MKDMMHNQLAARRPVASLVVLAVITAATAMAADVPTRKESDRTSVIATVSAIDQQTREVTLKGPLGNSVTFIAGPEIKRLNEVQVGDTVSAEYYVSVAAELREPTAEEAQKPLTMVDATSRATEGAPAGVSAQRIKAVTTIEGLDRPTQTITVKGPLGRYHTVRVADPSRLEKMKIGDTIVITFTEAVAVVLEKTSTKMKE